MSQELSPAMNPQNVGAPAEGFAGRWRLLVGLAVLAGALGYFAFLAFQSATVYFYTVGEISGQEATPDGRTVRVGGKLVPESFHRADGSTVANFALTDGTETLAAIHDGILPDLFFNEHSEIILEGAHAPGEPFVSERVIVKCPSKYAAMEDEAG